MPNETHNDEATARELQERLERNREVVLAQRRRESESLVEVGRIETRTEEVPCRDCQTPVNAAVLCRPVAVDDETGEVEWERRVPPVMCARCSADDQVAQEFASPQELGPTDPLEWLALLGVNTRKHGHATIENFDASDAPDAPREAERFVAEVVDANPHDYVSGLYLVSEKTGTGKSHLAVAIMRAVHEQRPSLSIMYEPADRLVSKVQDSYGSGTTDQLIEARKRAGLYVLDDLGREKSTGDALRLLCTVLDEREGHPTVITSNGLPHELGVRYADESTWARVASRLGDEVYTFVAVDGRDRRFKVPVPA